MQHGTEPPYLSLEWKNNLLVANDIQHLNDKQLLVCFDLLLEDLIHQIKSYERAHGQLDLGNAIYALLSHSSFQNRRRDIENYFNRDHLILSAKGLVLTERFIQNIGSSQLDEARQQLNNLSHLIIPLLPVVLYPELLEEHRTFAQYTKAFAIFLGAILPIMCILSSTVITTPVLILWAVEFVCAALFYWLSDATLAEKEAQCTQNPFSTVVEKGDVHLTENRNLLFNNTRQNLELPDAELTDYYKTHTRMRLEMS